MIGMVHRRKAFTPTQGIHWAHPKCGQVRQALVLLPEPEHTAADRRAAWPLASGWSASGQLRGAPPCTPPPPALCARQCSLFSAHSWFDLLRLYVLVSESFMLHAHLPWNVWTNSFQRNTHVLLSKPYGCFGCQNLKDVVASHLSYMSSGRADSAGSDWQTRPNGGFGEERVWPLLSS